MFLNPINDYITVRQIEQELKTPGGLHLPEANTTNQFLQGVVVRVGRGTLTQSGSIVPPQVQVGDRVLFRKGRGSEIKFNGKDVLFLTERDFLATIRDTE